MSPYILRRCAALFCLSLGLGSLAGCGAAAPTPEPTALPTPTGEALNLLSSETGSTQAETFEAMWAAVDENYIYRDDLELGWDALYEEYAPRFAEETDPETFNANIEALLDNLPEDTYAWQSREERLAAAQDNPTSFEGIGAFVAFRAEDTPRIVLLSIIDGSPAEAAGLQAHESITAIDGQPITAEEGLGAVERIRGEAGSDVSLTVRAPDGDEREVTVTRASISGDRSDLQPDYFEDGQIGYILFPPFPYETMIDDLEQVVALFAAEGEGELGGLIFDLRITSGGASWPTALVGILWESLAEQEVGTLYGRAGANVITPSAETEGMLRDVPVAILIGPDTRGWAEVFAAGMQGQQNALLLGLPTEGRIETLNSFPLPDGTEIFLAVGSFRTATGREIGVQGVVPDIPLRQDWDDITGDDDPVLERALEELRTLDQPADDDTQPAPEEEPLP